MKALIFENIVQEISVSEFPVHESFTWMDCPDNCKAGWSESDGVLSAPANPPEPTWHEKRKAEYPPIAEQLDILYHSGVAGLQAELKKTKDKFPKPE